MEKPLRVLTWHIHGSYLYYLTQTPCEFYLPVKEGKPEGYGGRSGHFAWGSNAHDVPVEEVKHLEVDCILFQSRKNYLEDQYEILSPEQRALPKIFLEHDPPREVPTDTRHVVDDPDMLLVHVTHFNNLMWDNNRTPTKVIQHGVVVPQNAKYTGELEKGIVVINGLSKRGRRLGLDVFEAVRQEVPLDLVGMGSKALGGLGEIPGPDLPAFIGQYRFFFNPIRYTSLGLAVCEAMMVGLPIVGLATTEMSVAIKNRESGFVDTNVAVLIERMKMLLQKPVVARELSKGAQQAAQRHFNISHFTYEWSQTFHQAVRQTTNPTNRRYLWQAEKK
ncbi:glycosyl transferase family 1 [Pontibacter ummariensis]|uniref:Glycosyl transferases group 1 n=1 Tax=Pontibacter ummariensis TaxID=1610492 RepID=A0A239FF77_9BACT|nr:glycosyltransferase [Pontibacter ummariensis]PRY12280.1 glycosyl transferase family 1 [Pontibacter ummariensis]SNS55579.1 Glycosyl transferases group 1 [Pontibacter ummariensis]